MPFDGPTRTRTIRAADLFCGAGGTSTGLIRAAASLGASVDLVAVNHWSVAIDTHSTNHPDQIHFCQDLATVRTQQAVPDGRLDLLVASPTCTHHSRARGGRPTDDQQRMDPWHVITWLTSLKVTRLMVENVPEFMEWGPVEASGRPDPVRKGEFFRAWVDVLRSIGYTQIDYRVVVCADFGDATTRRRFLLLARNDGKAIRWPAATHGQPGKPAWRAAAEIIDWSKPGRCVFGRAVPLKPNTLRRLMTGVARHFGGIAAAYTEALQVELDRSIARWGDATATKAGRESAKPINDTGDHPLALTPGNAEPFVLGQQSCAAPRATSQPLPTISTAGAISLARPMITAYYGASDGCKRVDQPLDTITTKARFGLAAPFLLAYYTQTAGRERAPHAITDPLPTITTQPALVWHNHSRNQSPLPKSKIWPQPAA